MIHWRYSSDASLLGVNVKEKEKTKEQLLSELAEMRQSIDALKESTAGYKQAEDALLESENRFRSIAGTASDAIIIFDSDENIFFWNEAAKVIFGYSAGETRGEILDSIMSSQSSEMFQTAIQQVIATGKSELIGKTIEAVGIRKDGSEFPVELSLASWRTRAEAFFTIIARDITERKQAEKALKKAYAEVEERVEERTAELQREIAERKRVENVLRKSETRLELAIAGSNGGEWHYTLGPDDAWHTLPEKVYISPRLKGFIGYKDDELPNSVTDWESRILPKDLVVLRERSREHREGRTDVYEVDYRIRHKDGNIRWLHSRGKVQWDKRGRPLWFAGIDWDITDRKRTEEALWERTHELGERVKELNCLYGISHLVEEPDISLEEILQESIDLILPAWQYPQVTCARVILEDQEFRTNNFRETPWKQSADIIVCGGSSGTVEVCYLEERSEGAEGPFLEEERNLLNVIAERLGSIAERKRAEEALRESEERFRTLIEGSVEGILVHRDTKPLFVNPAYVRILGYESPDEILIIDSVVSLIAPYEQERLLDYHAARVKGESAPTQYEYDAVCKDGSIVTLQQLATTISWDGKPSVLAAIIDITTRKQTEEALHRYTAELEMRNEELDAFAHTVAHDLKNPVSLIIGFADVLEADSATMPRQGLQKYLYTIAQNGRKINSIIDELLLLAGVREKEVEMAPLDMAGIVTEAQGRLVHMIEEHHAEIVLPDAWPVSLGYGPWVEEVWVNYLSNAIKYGGQPPHAELGATVQPDGAVRFWVHDNGPGLTPEEQARLFTPFTRLDQARAKGHGLGLSIVRRIVEKLGGQVGINSRDGQGSVFTFTLPSVANAEIIGEEATFFG